MASLIHDEINNSYTYVSSVKNYKDTTTSNFPICLVCFFNKKTTIYKFYVLYYESIGVKQWD
jgi:hypothetical protein